MFTNDPLRDLEPLLQRVYAYIAYRVGDGPEAEDLTSDTLERALRYRSSFDPRKGDPGAWLIGIARRCIASGASGRSVSLETVPERAAQGELEADTLRRLELAAAVAQLDERDRELVALRFGADLTARQIGELLGLKTNAVEVALHRVLARLGSILAAGEPPAADLAL